jgi:hypothetical protein
MSARSPYWKKSFSTSPETVFYDACMTLNDAWYVFSGLPELCPFVIFREGKLSLINIFLLCRL